MKKGKEVNNKPNTKEKVDPNKKLTGNSKNARDLIPSNSPHIKNIRETFPIRQSNIPQEELNEIKQLLIFSKPCEVLPEWPNEDDLINFSSLLESEKEPFKDPFNQEIIFPSKFDSNFAIEAKWLRPEEYVRNNLLNKEIKISFPNKNIFKIRNEIKEFYYQHELPNRKHKKDSNENNNNEEDYENYYDYDNNNFQFNQENIDKSVYADKSISEILEILHKKRNSFRDCFKILDKKLDLKVVNWTIREENDEEYKLRKEQEYQEKLKQMEKEKEQKGKKKPTISSPQNKPNKKETNNLKPESDLINLENDDRLKIKEIKPSNIYFLNEPKYNNYLKWFVSILQLIKDLNLCDVQTGKSIILNIYPQKENFPVISTSGKYWIKVYFMGKPRKIEIDDYIPCNKNEEFIFPRCDRLDEIWPALLTKALLKLHTYKRISKYAEEVGDLAIIYSLTGYIVEKLPINSLRVSNIEKYLQSNLNYLNKHKVIACMAWKEEIKESPKHSSTIKGKSENFKNNLIKLGSKTSLISIDTNNLNVIPEENKKNIFENMTSILKKRMNLNSKTLNQIEVEKNKIIENSNKIQGKSENNINSPTGNNYINFLKNIPEENNFELNQNPKKDNFDDKISETSEFNSINENITNNNENNFNIGLTKSKNANNNQIEKKTSIKTPKYMEFIQRLKSIHSDTKNKGNNTRRSSVAFFSLKSKEDMNIQKTLENENDILNNNKYEIENKSGQKYLVSLGRNENSNLKSSKNMIKFDFNLDLADKPDSHRDDILGNYLYPILDFFDNKKFNMQRLKPLDFSDIKRLGQEGRTPGIYKQLSKEDKKKYLENLLEVKTKQRDMKNKRIEEIKREGRRYNFIKLKNNTIGIPKLDFFVPYSDKEILMTKKCLENKWEFPPPSYYDNYENSNREITETTVNLSVQNEINNNNNLNTNNLNKELEILEDMIVNSGKEDPIRDKNNNEIPKNNHPQKKKNENKTEIHRLNLISDKKQEEIQKNNNDFQNEMKENLNEKKKDNLQDNKKNNTWSKDIYLNIIEHNLEQFENSVEPLSKYIGGNWINYSEFKKYFNFFILLHHPKSFKNQTICDNIWRDSYDFFEYNKNTSVLFLNNINYYTDNSVDGENKNINEKKDQENINQEIIDPKRSSLLVLFEPNNSLMKTEGLEELFFYANFDLIDSFGKEIQSNIILSKFYSTYYTENLEKEKNYFLLLKSFICPFGFNFSVYSDHGCDCMDYGTYLKKFFGFDNKIFKIEHLSLERNKTSLIGKFKIKLSEKTYFKINLNHPDKLSKKFIEMYLQFGKFTQNKKRINFDLNEKILFDPLSNDDEYILSILINPPYILNSNTLEVDFYFDKDSTIIDLLELNEPFKLYDRIKTNKYGIVFKEFIFAFENTFLTFDLRIQKQFNINQISNNQKKNSNLNLIQLQSNNSNSIVNYSENINNLNLEKLLKDEGDFNEKVRMKLKISKGEDFLLEEEFFNKITIQNMLLNYSNQNDNNSDVGINLNLAISKNNLSTNNLLSNTQGNNQIPKEITPYHIICFIDLSELKNQKDSLDNLEWVLRVFSSEPLLIIKDTSKEDSEKLLKDNWENTEPGRSEKARKSRLKHLIICKKNMGKKLTLEEEQLLLEERPKTVSTFSINQHNESNNIPNVKGIRDNEKDKKIINDTNKKGNNLNLGGNTIQKQKTNKNLPSLDSSNKINDINGSSKSILNIDVMKKPVIANPNNHKSHYIKKFLQYTEQERIVKKENLTQEEQKVILNELNVREINEQINKQVENFEAIRKTEGDETLNKSILSRENLKTFYKTTNTFRVKARDNCSQLYKQRDLLRTDLTKVIEIENSINDILKNNLNFDFNYSIGIYKESVNIEGIKSKLREKLFQYISFKKDEFYKNEIKKLTQKDKNTIIKYMEDINENKWLISAETMIKFEQLTQDPNPKK